MGNATTVRDHISSHGKAVITQHAAVNKPLFIPTPLQMVLQLQEWKKDVRDWEKEYRMITRLINMTRLSSKYSTVAGLFKSYSEFMNQNILMLHDRIQEYECGLKDREAQLIPQADISEFEELQVTIKGLKKEINDFKLPVLEAIVKDYPVSIM